MLFFDWCVYHKVQSTEHLAAVRTFFPGKYRWPLSTNCLSDVDASVSFLRIRLSLYQTDLQEFFQTSRYRSEYDDEVFLARGGFGAVYRARNKLDGCSYAIKKVLCRGDRDTFTKIIREVTTLASLDHPNIVSYKTAWLEPFIPGEGSLAQEVAVSSGEAKETVSSCSWSPEEEVSSGGIVFEASKGKDSS